MLMTLTFFEDYNHCGTKIITLFCTNGFLFSEIAVIFTPLNENCHYSLIHVLFRT